MKRRQALFLAGLTPGFQRGVVDQKMNFFILDCFPPKQPTENSLDEVSRPHRLKNPLLIYDLTATQGLID